MCKCPTIGDLFCSFFNCFSCRETKCEPKCEHKCEHKEERCEKRFECVCREEKHEDSCHEPKPERPDNCCACRVK